VTKVRVAARRLGAHMMSTHTAAFAIVTGVEAAHPPPPRGRRRRIYWLGWLGIMYLLRPIFCALITAALVFATPTAPNIPSIMRG
jgi:hypothetical protein